MCKSGAADSVWLPPEIWIHIFLLATSVPYTPQLYEIAYLPFHNPPREQERFMLSLADGTILALSLVCQEWHTLSIQFLFETVHLSWYGSQKLHECLKRSVGGVSCGKWARRLELSVIEHEDADYPIFPADVFLSCPNIEVLVKCDDDLLPHSVGCADLTGLKRFDWYYARYRDGDHQFAIEDDDPSRGQDFLRDVVRNAPNLQYLSLVKRFRGTPRASPPPSAIILPSLVTLHLELISLDVWTEIETWSFPLLRILRVDATFPELPRSSARIWDTVQVVELLQDQGSIPSPSRLPTILKMCPNATELNYYLEYVSPPPPGSAVWASIQVVRLHFATNHDLRWPVEEEDELWNHISAHFDVLTSPMFPSLKRVVLYGPWDFITTDERFRLFKQKLVNHGCRLDSESNGGLD
ncbi:hypothetical protein B0H19DRAFT_1112647 [Mycena capillaripes]|nr:hypothetical protein B0H19DRAFT_1112647 [Mycena capillaripes]